MKKPISAHRERPKNINELNIWREMGNCNKRMGRFISRRCQSARKNPRSDPTTPTGVLTMSPSYTDVLRLNNSTPIVTSAAKTHRPSI